MLGLLSFYQLPQPNAPPLPAPPQCSDSRQTNRDLLPQIHGKASKDTIPTVYSIKTHHTHKTTKISLYWMFRPEKRNSTGTKTERKNRRNAWFEQTQCSKLPPHWHCRLDLLLPFFFFLLFLVCCPCPLLWFLLFFGWTMNIVMWYLFFLFGILFEIS